MIDRADPQPHPPWARLALIAGIAIGLLAAWLTLRAIDWHQVAEAARRLGVGGFVALCVYSLGVFAMLGAAWGAAGGEPIRRWPLFAGARLVREAAADLLPYAQIGGLIAAAELLRARGLTRTRIWASMIADQVTEMASQLVFTLAGVAGGATLLLGPRGAALRPLVLAGTGGLVLLVLGFLLAHRRAARLAARLAARALPAAAGSLQAVEAELGRLYASRGGIAASFGWNLAAWLGSAGASWLMIRLAGGAMPFWRLVTLESLIAVVRSAAFFVPGALGLQEAAYALIGPLVGLPAGMAVTLSLARRARDVALGVPALLLAQGWGLRAAVRAG